MQIPKFATILTLLVLWTAPKVEALQMQTQHVTFKANFPAQVTGPYATTLQTQVPFLECSRACIAAGNSQPFNFSAKGNESMSIRINGGKPITIRFEDSNFANPAMATAAEVGAAIDNDLWSTGAGTLAFASWPNGQLSICTIEATANSSLQITDGIGSPAAILGLSTSLAVAPQFPANFTTHLYDLAANTANYAVGDQILINGTSTSGEEVSGAFTFGGNEGIRLQHLMNTINFLYKSDQPTGAMCYMEDGKLSLASNFTGPSNLSIAISDSPDSIGHTNWAQHPFVQTVTGSAPDVVSTAEKACDALGNSHMVSYDFFRRADDLNHWDLHVSVDPQEGEAVDGLITQISFDVNGRFAGSSEPLFSVIWNTQPAVFHTILCDFGFIGSDQIQQSNAPPAVTVIEFDGCGQ